MRKVAIVSLLFLSIYIIPALGQERKVLFPRFVSSTNWTSEFFFTNQGLANLSIKIDFFDKNGAAASVVDSNLGAGSSFTFVLNSGGAQVISLSPSATMVEGYAIATYPGSASPVRGSEIFRHEENAIVFAEVGGSQQEFGQHYSFPVENNSGKGIRTAVGFTKPAYVSPNKDESLVVNLLNSNGTLRATKLVPMKAGQHMAGYVHEDWLFPGLPDPFVGSISVSSPFGAGVLVLRQDREAFGAVSTDGGAMISPFAVASPIVQEVEPNDDKTTAQSLLVSTAVEGSSSQAGDLDTYKFTGKSGDIVTIICDTTQKNSNLDPMIFLFDANYAAISANDRNGLAPSLINSGDSFIQCVLPQDGTYYITVLDYHGGTGDYVLHVNLRHL
jgi:hypothetical protein